MPLQQYLADGLVFFLPNTIEPSLQLAALFAAVPLMLGFGDGAELRRPLGLAIFGGLVLSQLLTLFTTPVIYLAFDRLGRRFGRQDAA